MSQIAVDLPELMELDINPLLADSQGCWRSTPASGWRAQPARPQPAIRPYPAELEERFTLADGRAALLRPIRPEDEPDHHVCLTPDA